MRITRNQKDPVITKRVPKYLTMSIVKIDSKQTTLKGIGAVEKYKKKIARPLIKEKIKLVCLT